MVKLLINTATAQTLLEAVTALVKGGASFEIVEDAPPPAADEVKPVPLVYVPPSRHRVTYRSTNLPVKIALGNDMKVYRFIQTNPWTSARNIAQSTGLKTKVVESSIWRLRHTNAIVSYPVE